MAARRFIATALCVAPTIARGDETIVIVDQAPSEAAPDRDRTLGEAPFVTVIHPDDHPDTASVADALATSAGAQTRSLGGLGAYESVAVRGAAPGQTAVLIDGIPLAKLAQVTVDLGRFALDAFGEVDLYRGAVPVELGGAGVGGAINMITRLGPGDHGERWRASIGAGSFGARHVSIHHGDVFGAWATSTTLGYQSATGDFPYFYNSGTPLNLKDDTTQVRKNNGFDQLDVATRAGRLDRALAGGVRVAYKDQGLPGSVAQPAAAASMRTLDVIADAHAEQGDARELTYVLVEDQRLADPLGELGPGSQARRYRTLSAGASASYEIAGVELRADHFTDTDDRGMQPTVVGARYGGAAMIAKEIVLAPQLAVTLAARLDTLYTSPAALTVGPMALEAVPARWDIVPSPRVSVRAPIAPDVAIKGSAGYYVRLPTLVELFGDRGFLLGAPDLRPERGPNADLGVVWAPARGLGAIDRVFVAADVFASRPRNTIAFITTAGFVGRAANIGDTQSYGGELIASVRIARVVSLTANYTRVDTEQISDDRDLAGKPIPRTPGHLAYARADVALPRSSVYADAAYQSTCFLDPASLGEVPARVLIGAGAHVDIGGGMALALDISNLLDDRVVQLPLVPPPRPDFTSTPAPLTDVAGFPLPGRSVFVSLHWSHR